MRGIVRLVSATAAILLVAGLAPSALAGSPGHGPKAPNDPGRRYNQGGPKGGADSLWGLAVTNAAVNQQALEQAMGRTFEAQGIYLPLTGSHYPVGWAEDAANNGARIYLNITSWHYVGDKKVCYPYADYAKHTYDAYLQSWVNQLLSFDYSNTYITFNHEPSVSSEHMPLCGTGSEYASAYDYIFHYFRNHGVTNPFVWWMLASAFNKGWAQDWEPPTADFSVIAVDGWNQNLGGDWHSPDYIFTASYEFAKALGKPLAIGEVGCLEDAKDAQHKAEWLSAAAELFRAWGTDTILWTDARGYEPTSSRASLAAWVTASKNAGASFLANVSGNPGSTESTWGAGFKPGEMVEVHLDNGSGTVVGAKVADGSGVVSAMTLHLPTPLPGGMHTMLAVGRSSGNIAKAQLSVTPPSSPVFTIAAGDTYRYLGLGFVPGEAVSVEFPGGSPTIQTADASGSVAIDAVSPPEPHGGLNKLSVKAASASLTVNFHPLPVLDSFPTGLQPQQNLPLSLTGFGAAENVTVKIDGAVKKTLVTDQAGSASGSLGLDTTFGRHVITVVGASSQVTKGHNILLKPTLTLSPTSGPSGTQVLVTSGPGWIPGESVQVKLGSTVVATVTADATGSVSTTLTITRKTPGTVHVSLHGLRLQLAASGDFTVT